MKVEKLMFAPLGIAAGIAGGLLAGKAFEAIWARIDEDDPPGPDDPRADWPKLIAALAIEGAVIKLVRGAVDHGARRGFANWTGAWPGEPELPPGDPAQR